MNELELKKTKAELMRVQAGKAEMEYIIAQREDEIKRVKENIKIQEAKEKELQEKIKGE